MTAAFSVALLVPAGGVAAVSTPVPQQDPQVEQLQALVGEASREETAALQSLLAVRSRRQDLDRRVHSLDSKIAESSGRLQAAEADVQRLAGAYLEQSGRVDDADARLDAARSSFEDSLVRLYRDGGDSTTSFAKLFPHTDSLQDRLRERAYLASVAAARRATVGRFAGLRDETIRERDALDGERQRAATAQAEATRDRERLAKLRAEQDADRRDAAAEEAKEKRLLDDIQSRKDEYTRQLGELTVVSETIQTELHRRQAGQKAGTSRFRHPVDGPIVSGFGSRVHPIFKTVRMHTGVDFQAGTGTPIRAAGDGVVAIAGVRGGYGNAVVIDHGNQLATVYAHQSKIAVSVGQAVRAGQVIGYVGMSGWATGPHLHFEVRVLGTPVNPTKYF